MPNSRSALSYQHSPAFWVTLLAIAVGLNALALVLLARVSPRPPAPIRPPAVPIDLVEIPPEAIPRRTTTRRSAVPAPTIAPLPAAAPEPEVPAVTIPEPRPDAGRSPTPPPPTPRPATPTPPPTRSTSGTPTPAPMSPATPLPSGTPAGPVSSDEDEGLPGVDVAANPDPIRLQVTVAVVKSDQDVASRPATPTTTTLTLEAGTSDCPITPESNRFLGSTVELLIEVDPRGQVVPTQTLVQEPVDSGAYDALAICLIHQWAFTPAADQQADTLIPRSDSLRVQMTISALN